MLVTVLLSARQRQESSLRLARQQTADILRTVKDGLFLLDQNLVIGSAYSGALETLFQRKDFAGLAFESLLKNIVSEKTLTTALKFVKILWSERTNEKLVKTINPLGEVEVHLDNGSGKFDTRYLQFDFHRVRVDGEMTQVLVSVSDVSARVDLARELQTSQSQAQGQVDTLLGILHIDPAQLSSFLNDSNAAMKMINAVLREPTREEGVFRKKLDTLFRQVHSVKGEAAALGMSSIESRAHAFEEDLKALRDKPSSVRKRFSAAGDQARRPAHASAIGRATWCRACRACTLRRKTLRTPSPTSPEKPKEKDPPKRRSRARDGANADAGLAATLQQLAARVAARKQQGSGRASASASTRCPTTTGASSRTSACRPCAMPSCTASNRLPMRLSAGKPQQGLVRLTFQDSGRRRLQARRRR